MTTTLPLARLQDAVERMAGFDAAGEPTPAFEQATRAFRADPNRVTATGLLIAALRIAVWYRVPLSPGFARRGLKTELANAPAATWDRADDPGWRDEVVTLAGTVAGTTRRYQAAEGPVAEAQALHEVLCALVIALLGAFDSVDRLRTAFEVEVNAPRDTKPADEANPTSSRALRLFEPIMRRTYCPFAATARLWGAPDYDPALSFTENMDASLPGLKVFSSMLQSDVLDGYVYAFPTEIVGGKDVAETARLFRAFMGHLIEHATGEEPRPFDRDTVTDERWRLWLYGEQFFVTVFAPCYPHGHSRYAYGNDEAVLIMLQPEESIHAAIPHDTYDARADGIRQRFEEAFQAYHVADAEADRFLLPTQPGGEPVRWYDAEADDPVIRRPAAI
ncbi:hypothetical protein [Krasilnikovia sp. M28-CT-15]|uniref:hypothetical protein n=1 Tax=Krasilnikovia sp. M28-CT-15 TaxID=3373540 RepID=UPI003876955E